eukprot:scaffold121694_cov28-Tisochrysis_lutea.AAC.3
MPPETVEGLGIRGRSPRSRGRAHTGLVRDGCNVPRRGPQHCPRLSRAHHHVDVAALQVVENALAVDVVRHLVACVSTLCARRLLAAMVFPFVQRGHPPRDGEAERPSAKRKKVEGGGAAAARKVKFEIDKSYYK